jgi:adenosine kinase
MVVDHPVDPTGAGDSFRSGLLAGLYWGRSWEDAARLGNAVGYHVVQSMGTMNHVFEKEDVLNQIIKN